MHNNGDVVWIEHEYYTWLEVGEDGGTIPPVFHGPVPAGITRAVHRDVDTRAVHRDMDTRAVHRDMEHRSFKGFVQSRKTNGHLA